MLHAYGTMESCWLLFEIVLNKILTIWLVFYFILNKIRCNVHCYIKRIVNPNRSRFSSKSSEICTYNHLSYDRLVNRTTFMTEILRPLSSYDHRVDNYRMAVSDTFHDVHNITTRCHTDLSPLKADKGNFLHILESMDL